MSDEDPWILADEDQDANGGIGIRILDHVVIGDGTYASFLERGIAGIGKFLGRSVSKEKMTAADAEAALGRIEATPNLAAFSDCDLVVEAIVEDAGVKKAVFTGLQSVLADDAILASNTSSISITELAAASGRPERFIGMHFMNPVPLMKLVEIIRGLATSDETYQKVHDARGRGMSPIEGAYCSACGEVQTRNDVYAVQNRTRPVQCGGCNRFLYQP